MQKPRNGTALGVNVVADLTVENGLGESSRTTVDAMLSRGINVSLVELQSSLEKRSIALEPRFERLPRGIQYSVTLLLCNLNELADIPQEYMRALTARTYTIAYWVWELPEIPARLHGPFSYVDEVWVPSHFVGEVMRRVTTSPVIVVPRPVDVTPSGQAGRSFFGIPDSAFVFLCSFAATSSVTRKNPLGVIAAFGRAFGRLRPGGPLLVVKAQHLDMWPPVRDSLRTAVSRVGGLLLKDTYPRANVADLFSNADIYVSLHRSEGFGRGIAECMQLGKPVIATDYSGNSDFMTVDNSYPIRYHLVKISTADHSDQPEFLAVYENGQLWAEPDLDGAAEVMESLYRNPDAGRVLGRRAFADSYMHCSVHSVGRKIETRLQRVLNSSTPPIP